MLPHEVRDAFLRAMIGAGLSPQRDSELLADGRLHRYVSEGDRPGKRNAWYVLHLDGKVPGGAFGSWRTGQAATWSAKEEHEFTAEEREEWRQRQQAMRAQRERDLEKTAIRARKIWDSLPWSGKSPYLQRKKVRAFGIKFAGRGTIVVPVRDLVGRIWGLQFIAPDGTKRFLTGTAKKGRFHLIDGSTETLALCEGYATGATIHMATGWRVAVAFDAGNLLPVAVAFRERCPDLDILVCGDDDRFTPGNPGRSGAMAAARAAKARVVFPDFSEVPAT